MNTSSTTLSPPDHRSITALAYQYYVEEGRPEGQAEEHWFRAERALKAEATAGPRDKNGVREAELSRFVAEGGSVTPPVSEAKPPLSEGGEKFREQYSAPDPAPRQSSRPFERSRPTR
jgi:hypothetical protein